MLRYFQNVSLSIINFMDSIICFPKPTKRNRIKNYKISTELKSLRIKKKKTKSNWLLSLCCSVFVTVAPTGTLNWVKYRVTVIHDLCETNNRNFHTRNCANFNRIQYSNKIKKFEVWIFGVYIKLNEINQPKMGENWCGKAVSIKCVDDFGIFQGTIKDANTSKIVISRAFRNGLPLKTPDAEVTIMYVIR